MTDRPRYFQPLELPDYCYLWEAIMWVAFGRFPQGSEYIITDGRPSYYDEQGHTIGALSFNWKDSVFRQDYQFHGFWWYEIEAAGLTQASADWERYDRILQSHGYIRPTLLADEIERVRARPKTDDRDETVLRMEAALHATMDAISGFDRPHYLENMEKRLAETPFIDGVHKLFQHHVDRAWVKIFQGLVDGSFQAYGWRELSQDEIREHADEIQLSEVSVLKPEDGSVLYTLPEHRWLGRAEIVNPFRRPMPVADLIGPLDPMATLDVMPVTEFGLTGIAPDGHYQSPTTGHFWWDVIVPTDAIFANWPKPILAAKSDQMHIEHLTPDIAISTGRAETRADKQSAPSHHHTVVQASPERQTAQSSELARRSMALAGTPVKTRTRCTLKQRLTPSLSGMSACHGPRFRITCPLVGACEGVCRILCRILPPNNRSCFVPETRSFGEWISGPNV